MGSSNLMRNEARIIRCFSLERPVSRDGCNKFLEERAFPLVLEDAGTLDTRQASTQRQPGIALSHQYS
jgi:hypothetical protein